MLKIGLIGDGDAAHNHANAISALENAQVAAVSGRGSTRGRALAASLGVPYFMVDTYNQTELTAMLRQASLDAVTICLAHAFHANATLAAAEAGLHVLVEKPMATSLADADRMIEACRRAGVILMVGQTYRFMAELIGAKRRISAGELGRPAVAVDLTAFSSASVPLRPWYFDPTVAGGGVLMSSASHRLDRLRWLVGEIEEVYARLGAFSHPIETEDTAVVNIGFANGAVGSLVQEVVSYPLESKIHLDLYGSRASFHHRHPGHLMWTGIDGVEDLSVHGDHPMVRELAEFVAAVSERREPSVPGEEGRATLAALLACYTSARKGRPVRVNEGAAS
jgi:UDP-N-acetyl-2-amino-2-deoxyglucuronate dehydrogenase